MSDFRIALVAEGITDAVVIDAALKAILPFPFVLTQLQPEPTQPHYGGGWGGVLRWCYDFATRGHPYLEDDPILPNFDLFILHVDADVAEKSYSDVSESVSKLALDLGWSTLPCHIPCPPPSRNAEAMRKRLLEWAGLAAPGPRTVLCIPSKAPEAWLIAATFAPDHPLLQGLECNLNLEARLGALPRNLRVKKSAREYRSRGWEVTRAWSTVRERCSQADQFSIDVLSIVETHRLNS